MFPSEAALEWRVLNQPWTFCGNKADVPVPGDYDGDGAADFAAYSVSNGRWSVCSSQGLNVRFGDPGDVPIPGDYNGDGVTDIAVYRPSTGQWFVRNQFAVQFGDSGDVPIPR